MRFNRWTGLLLAAILLASTVVLAPLANSPHDAAADEGDNPNHLFLPYVSSGPRTGTSTGPTVTPTATDTPSPTATATATSTPSPTPTQIPTPGPLEVLPNDTHFVDSDGSLWIFGEVQNTVPHGWHDVHVTAHLYDRDDVVDTRTNRVHRFLVPGRRKACFRTRFADPPENWTDYELEIAAYTDPTYYYPETNFFVYVSYARLLRSDWFEIVGTVRNPRGRTFQYVKVIGTLYDHEGRVFDCDSAELYDLHPGEIDAFWISFDARHEYYGVDDYDLAVEGFRYYAGSAQGD